MKVEIKDLENLEGGKLKAFVSHSKKDKNGRTFIETIFAGVENSAYFYSYQGTHPPHAQTLKNVITTECKSLIVLLSSYLLSKKHTASWVSYEVGIAHATGLNVWVFENIEDDPINMPIPYVSAYVQRKSELKLRATPPYDTIGDFAGTKIPEVTDVNSINAHKYYGKITCPNHECKAEYTIFLLNKKYRCPVCRKSYNAGKVSGLQHNR